VYRSDLFLQGIIAPLRNAAASSYVLSSADANRLSLILRSDATDSFYSAAVSFSDALAGIEKEFFSWATVKLYYATYYALQAILATDGHCLFHLGKSPRWLQAQAGAKPARASGTTHDSILTYFERKYPTSILLSQPIDSVPALRWLARQRVQANYANSGFSEPVVPSHFKTIRSVGVRQAIQSYSSDTTDLYLFDRDHAMVAFPIRSLKIARNELAAQGCPTLEDERAKFLKSAFRDRHGPLAGLQAIVY